MSVSRSFRIRTTPDEVVPEPYEETAIQSMLTGRCSARAMHLPVQMDWMAVSSYGSGTKSSGVVRILKDLDTDISGRHVLIVEDIIDSGLTLSWLVGNLRSRDPASVAVCAMLRKPSSAQMDVDVAYTGFDVPDEFVVGYGLDYAERYRNLPFIGTLAPEVYGGGNTSRRG